MHIVQRKHDLDTGLVKDSAHLGQSIMPVACPLCMSAKDDSARQADVIYALATLCHMRCDKCLAVHSLLAVLAVCLSLGMQMMADLPFASR